MSLNKLISLPKFGNGIGLHRMMYLCHDLLSSSWLRQVDPIRVVGTNGKGSTTAMIAAILQEMGYATGQYTSPHLFKFNERIVINKESISDQELDIAIKYFELKREAYANNFPEDTIGAFEAITSIAFHHFWQKAVDALVVEAGIGGRYDPTRVMEGNFVAFTSIDLEHTQLLGKTLEQIAYDKLDIAAEGSSIIVGPLPKEVLRRLKAFARIKNVVLLPIEDFCELKQVNYKEDGMLLSLEVEDLEWEKLFLPLPGNHQIQNAMIAILTTKRWLSHKRKTFDETLFKAAVEKAFQKLRWPGRFERILEAPSTYIDVAHTPKAVEHIAKTAQSIIKKPIILVFGLSEGRSVEVMLRPLLPMMDAIVVSSAYHKGQNPEKIIEIIKMMAPNIRNVFKTQNIEQAIDFTLPYAKRIDMEVLITGSLFLAVEAHSYVKGAKPQDLRFF